MSEVQLANLVEVGELRPRVIAGSSYWAVRKGQERMVGFDSACPISVYRIAGNSRFVVLDLDPSPSAPAGEVSVTPEKGKGKLSTKQGKGKVKR